MSHLDNLPYALHTGRELELMLLGIKPLACFVQEYPAEPCEEIIPEAAFDVHLLQKRFEKREFVELLTGPLSAGFDHVKGFRRILYSLPKESWRIDAYIEMLMHASVSGWSEELERLEGHLLGYEEWQTDVWINRLLVSSHANNFPWLRRLAQKRKANA